MILFELRCDNDHRFEAWFRDGAAYDGQAAAGEIACPHCGVRGVAKAPMAPRLAKGRGAALDAAEAVREARKLLGALRRSVEASCENVGERFPEEARKIHYGETASRPIYGDATAKEARELEEEGVAVRRIPWIAGEH